MTFDEAVLRCLSKYSCFAGRARPSEFWWFMLLYFTSAGLSLIAFAGAPALVPVLLAASLALTIPALAVTVRRMHDLGLDGRLLLALVPVVGQVMMVIWLTRPSVPRLNRYGPEPAQRREKVLLYAR